MHVEELRAAVEDSALDPASGPGLLAVPVPDTLADAVLLHARALDPAARELAEDAAVIGRSFDFDLLVAVAEENPASVDRGRRQLLALHLVQPGADAVTFDFRHALIRDALYAEISLPRRRLLHQRVARAAAGRGDRDAFVSLHFELAGLAAHAHRHALRAARRAAGLSAHREALELYRRALRNLPGELPPAGSAALLAALGAEAAAADDNEAALEAFEQARELLVQAGDPVAAAALVPQLAAVAHLLGEGLDGRVRRLERALGTIDGLPGAEPVRARLLGALAAAYMLDRRLDQAIEYGERSRAAGDHQVDLNTAATLGSALVFAGRMDDGWSLLEEAVTRSIDQRQEAEAARGYRMIGSCASVLVEYDRAERWLADGIAYAERVELWNHHHYMAARLAHVRWARGEWDVAQRMAEHALADGRGGITTRITAQYVLGYLAMGRGDGAAATGPLGEALSLGERMDELQRLSPPLWGLAETELLFGEPGRAAALCERGYAASVAVADAAYPVSLPGDRRPRPPGALDDLDAAGRWLGRVEAALAARGIPGTLPAVAHGRGLVELAGGDPEAAWALLRRAGAAWRERGRFWEGTWALLDEAGCALRARRRVEAVTLAAEAGAVAERAGAGTIVTADGMLRGSGTGDGAAPAWHPLTAREYEIARLITEGLTNRAIAERLVLSPKTVGAHVEHILAKLGAARRAEIAAWAATISA
jgi:DNA-binding CsgD family transcriptional regulator